MLLGGFAGVLSLLEFIRPWQLDVGVDLSVSSLKSFGLFSPVWSPYIGGIFILFILIIDFLFYLYFYLNVGAIIGLLQIPSFLLINQGLGTSSGYVSFLSHILFFSFINIIIF